MSDLSKEYRKIMNELDKKITNKEDLDFVKEKVSDISIIFMDIIDRMNQVIEDRIINIENSQKNIESNLTKIQSIISTIEKDIYDEDMETEIICPYCNKEFFTDLAYENHSEIECPECHNIIELDMDSDNIEDELYAPSNCSGHCSRCKGCNEEDEENDEDL